MTAESALRADIVEVGRRMYARGYTASNDGNISVRLGADRLLMTPKSVCKGFMTPDMMCITDLDGRKLQGDRDPSSEMLMHLEVYRQRPDVAGGRARASADGDRVRRRRHPARSRRARRGADDAREHSDCGVRDAVHQPSCPKPSASYIKAHDGMLLANHGALTVGGDLFSAYYKMETIEHFAKISLVARLLGRENLIAREEVDPPAGAARHVRHQGAGADLSADDGAPPAIGDDPATCQVVQAPQGGGQRLVPDGDRRPRASEGPDGGEGEIRLTYRELSALIEDAIRNLR